MWNAILHPNNIRSLFNDIPHISLHYSPVPVQYLEYNYEYCLFLEMVNGAYPGFSSMKCLVVFLPLPCGCNSSPLQGYLFNHTHD